MYTIIYLCYWRWSTYWLWGSLPTPPMFVCVAVALSSLAPVNPTSPAATKHHPTVPPPSHKPAFLYIVTFNTQTTRSTHSGNVRRMCENSSSNSVMKRRCVKQKQKSYSLYIYIYMYMNIIMYIYIYIYTWQHLFNPVHVSGSMYMLQCNVI